jgi:hypothetical protein
MSNDKIDDAFDKLFKEEDTDVAVITERTFKATILPMIANQDEESADFSGWLVIAGAWRRPIDVTDDKSGEVLFRVPALVGKNAPPTEQTGHTSAYEVIQTARRKMQTIPRAGEEHLLRGLRPRMNVTGDHNENQRLWNAIYTRYGLNVTASNLATNEDASGSGKNDNPDVVGYDEI